MNLFGGRAEKQGNYCTSDSNSHSLPDWEQCVRCPDHQYANTEKNLCLLKSERFLDSKDPLGMTLVCLALCLSALTTAVIGIFAKHNNTPIVKANNRALSYILLISLNCCFLCSLLFIGHPNTATCVLQQTTFGVVFTVAVSTVLAKTVTVVLAFSVTSSGRRMRWLLVSGMPNFIIPIYTLIQLILSGIWLGTSPPFVDTDAHSEHGHIIILCNKAQPLPSVVSWDTWAPWSCSLGEEECLLNKKDTAYVSGDVSITGFFPLSYVTVQRRPPKAERYTEEVSYNFNNYQFILALAFAVEEINKNPHLLPNITMGFSAHSHGIRYYVLYRSLVLSLSGKDFILNYDCKRESQTVVTLTGPAGQISSQYATVLDLYRFPQLNFGRFDPVLSDHRLFPSVYQIAPKDTSLAFAMVSLMVHFCWKWVGLLISEDENGLWMLPQLREEMNKHKVCTAFEHILPLSFFREVSDHVSFHQKIRNSFANVVVIYGDNEFMFNLLNTYFTTYLSLGNVWVINSLSTFLFVMKYFLLHSLHAPLIFSHHHGEISGFNNFIKTANPSKYPKDYYLALVWIRFFKCTFSESSCVTWKNCPANASLEWLPRYLFDMDMMEESYYLYNAVYAVAQALHEMLIGQAEAQPVGNGRKLQFSPSQLHPFLKNIHFNNPAGDQVILDETKKLVAEYDIVNLCNFPEGLRQVMKVGNFSPYAPHGHQLSLSNDNIEWPISFTETPQSVCSESCGPGFRKSPQEGKSVCCFDCIPCPENEISNGTDLEQCVRCPDHQYANTEKNLCLLKSESFLNSRDPLGMTLVCLALCLSALTTAVIGIFAKHNNTPIVKANNRALSYILLISLNCCFLCSLLFIGHPNTATCVLQQTTFGVVFTVAVSTVLAKTVTVVLAFSVTSSGRRVRWLLVSGMPNFIIPSCTLIQLILSGIWLGTSPPFVDTDAHSEHGHIIILCNKGSATAFYCVLGYLGSLALASFTVAFLARNLPDTFNEAKFLTFSMLVFCSVWVTFLPVYHSTKGKTMVAVEVFSILASSAGLSGCIFVPKCYIILLRPERNSLHGIRGKTYAERNNPF
ncbi:vomeronasal type-2 receptor 116-like [Dipodomys spectabilis]|uniref:vomeronasal type-2 receptor 116-like n=1 Tax=Dipodomys spectabilis TaxID=105255 RepID=UPI001C539EB8|nr:vomeronasal type-2 receptor 116-like [Dipodomys spectabilis]